MVCVFYALIRIGVFVVGVRLFCEFLQFSQILGLVE